MKMLLAGFIGIFASAISVAAPTLSLSQIRAAYGHLAQEDGLFIGRQYLSSENSELPAKIYERIDSLNKSSNCTRFYNCANAYAAKVANEDTYAIWVGMNEGAVDLAIYDSDGLLLANAKGIVGSPQVSWTSKY